MATNPTTDTIMAAVQDLHDKISAVDPNLVVHITTGHRKLAPASVGNVAMVQSAAKPEDTNINWHDGNHFANAFSKTGDGFANVSWDKVD